MIRSAQLLIIGMLSGAAAMFVVVGSDAERARGPAPLPAGASERLAVYRAAAGETDLALLQNELESAAATAWSPARDVQIDALIARLSELAPTQTVTLARALQLDAKFVIEAVLNWAEVDPDAALRGLTTVDNAPLKQQIALALLAIFGDDNAGFDRISASLTLQESESLRVEWLGRRAEFDPVGAFSEAQALADGDLKLRVLERIASTWAEQDPIGALSQADILQDPLRFAYRSSVFNQWARLDGAGYLSWLRSVAAPPDEAVGSLRYLAITNPDRMLELAAGLTGDIGRIVRRVALQSLAEVDPAAAMTQASALPPGPDRDSVLTATAISLAASDPDTALAWAQNLSPPSPGTLRQVAMVIAQSHPDRALELIDNPPEGIDSRLIGSLMVSVVSSDPDQAEMLANQLIDSDNIQVRNSLRNLVGNWMQQDPDRALAWILAHDAQVDAGVFGRAAQALAQSDPAAAASDIDRIPVRFQSAWISQVAGPYARNDPAAALAWVAQYRGQSVYPSALLAAVTGSAQVDPRLAAEFIAQADSESQLVTAPQLAQIWASREPGAAARWAAELADDRSRASALGAAVSAWAVSDPGAARSWTLDLGRGPDRDYALTVLVSGSSVSGVVDRSLLNAYSSDSARQQTLTQVIPELARSNPEEAQQLLDLVTNSTTRRQLEERIEAIDADR
jgi:DNA-binding transcriptional regulator YbjK